MIGFGLDHQYNPDVIMNKNELYLLDNDGNFVEGLWGFYRKVWFENNNMFEMVYVVFDENEFRV